MTTTDAGLITTKEAADILRESVKNTIRRVQAGELTAVTKLPGLRGAYIFDVAVVTALRTQLNTSTPVEQPSPEADSAGVLSSGGGAA